ncbi:Major intrinsic protein [Nesidiocoris tenuis]|uniref:Major intrinsic protein n=1 Tax=Nesidiocoris tenuis TaxID=355587 RepID=A0ABN7BDK7_9HEMI|nr:Major intrinsic protein [Nesidiocoris tenuis]
MGTPLVLTRVTDSGGMTTNEFSPDTNLKIEEKKDSDSADSKSELSRYLEVFAAELVGTGLLLALGCASCVKGDASKQVTDFHSALTFGFIVSTIIGIFGHISAAHLNPAVTLAFYVLGHISIPMVCVYFAAQIMGAIMGVGVLYLLTPEDWIEPAMCVTQVHDSMTGIQGAAAEFLATLALILMVCGLSDPRCSARQDSVPLKFAGVIIAISLALGKYTGASMNPARSFGPAVWAGEWSLHWVYWVGPMSAAVVAPLFYLTCFLRGVQP